MKSFVTLIPHQLLFVVIKSVGMRWASHVARMREKRKTDVDERIVLK
jgi:hypothetical protein